MVTLNITSMRIIIFRMMYLNFTFSINYGQHGNIQHNVNAYHDIQNNGFILTFSINYGQHDHTQHNVTEYYDIHNNGFNFDIQYKL